MSKIDDSTTVTPGKNHSLLFVASLKNKCITTKTLSSLHQYIKVVDTQFTSENESNKNFGDLCSKIRNNGYLAFEFSKNKVEIETKDGKSYLFEQTQIQGTLNSHLTVKQTKPFPKEIKFTFNGESANIWINDQFCLIKYQPREHRFDTLAIIHLNSFKVVHQIIDKKVVSEMGRFFDFSKGQVVCSGQRLHTPSAEGFIGVIDINSQSRTFEKDVPHDSFVSFDNGKFFWTRKETKGEISKLSLVVFNFKTDETSEILLKEGTNLQHLEFRLLDRFGKYNMVWLNNWQWGYTVVILINPRTKKITYCHQFESKLNIRFLSSHYPFCNFKGHDVRILATKSTQKEEIAEISLLVAIQKRGRLQITGFTIDSQKKLEQVEIVGSVHQFKLLIKGAYTAMYDEYDYE